MCVRTLCALAHTMAVPVHRDMPDVACSWRQVLSREEDGLVVFGVALD